MQCQLITNYLQNSDSIVVTFTWKLAVLSLTTDMKTFQHTIIVERGTFVHCGHFVQRRHYVWRNVRYSDVMILTTQCISFVTPFRIACRFEVSHAFEPFNIIRNQYINMVHKKLVYLRYLY